MFRLATLVILAAVFLVLVWTGQRRLIYFPFGDLPAPESVGLVGVENVAFQTADELTLHGWLVPAAPSTEATTVLFFSGNAGDRSMRAPLAAALAARGIATLLVDYRGYGGNPGSPSEAGLAEDARAARAYLGTRPDVNAARIVYFGESLGTGVAVRLATEVEPMALVLRSPYTSMTDIGRHHYPWLLPGLILFDRFSSIDRIGRLKCPLLVIAGSRDSVIPADQSTRLFQAATMESKRLMVVDGADHNDYELLAGARVIDAVADFLAGLPGEP
jgi:fermentation-respiration switch protein FrsA (DUF1100 family)